MRRLGLGFVAGLLACAAEPAHSAKDEGTTAPDDLKAHVAIQEEIAICLAVLRKHNQRLDDADFADRR